MKINTQKNLDSEFSCLSTKCIANKRWGREGQFHGLTDDENLILWLVRNLWQHLEEKMVSCFVLCRFLKLLYFVLHLESLTWDTFLSAESKLYFKKNQNNFLLISFCCNKLDSFHKLVLIIRVSEHCYHWFLELQRSSSCPYCPTGCQKSFLHEKFYLNFSMPEHNFENF